MVAVQARAETAWHACHRRGTEGTTGGPLGHIAKTKLAALRGREKAVFFIAKFNAPDMDVLRELLESGEVKPVVEKVYELGDAADALRYMGEGHAQAKIVINV